MIFFFVVCRKWNTEKPEGAGAKQKQLIASTHGCDGFRRLK
jgi:hypothetical protein